MPSVLDHYNQYNTQSKLQWPGIKSARFGRTKHFLPHRDVIKSGLDMPNQTAERGQKHFPQKTSEEMEFRNRLRITPKINHWHLRESKKRILDVSLTVPHPRRQKGHDQPLFFHTARSAGIRTFYNNEVRKNNILEYSVEDKMQRKQRVDQGILRKTFLSKDSNGSFY